MSAVADTTSRMLTAAAELFATRGYNGTTTKAIAERAGVNEVTLFRRFQSKKGILYALGEVWAERMAGFAIEHVPEPEDTRGTLKALALLEVKQATEFGTVAMRLALDAPSSPDVAEVMGSGPGENFAGLVEYLTARQAAGDLRSDIDPRTMAEAFFALTSQLVMSRQFLGDAGTSYELSVEEVTNQAFEVYWAGVRAEGAR